MTESRDDLARENAKLRQINRVLIDRVERSTDAQGSAFSLFQAAITLEKTVAARTAELQALNNHLRDEIAERAIVQAALDRAKAAAEAANAGKTQFLAAASHDLTGPLGIARLFAGLLADKLSDAESRDFLRRIETSLESAQLLLASLLEMSRLDAGAMPATLEHFALLPLLERLRDEYAAAAEERNLRFRLVARDVAVHTDRLLLERLLRNLMSNALRYTERGGILVAARVRDDGVHVEVWDTGVGIAADALEHVFGEFARMTAPADGSKGLGLGLAIVRRIARLLELPLAVRSRVARGSVFAVTVPRGEIAEAGSAVVAAPARAGESLAGKTVLLVDDDAASLDGMTALVTQFGCRIVRADSAERAVAACRRLARGIDFAIADYHLPGTTGIDAIERVARLQARAFPAVVVTADGSDGIRTRVAERGFFFAPKPVRRDWLHALMERAIA